MRIHATLFALALAGVSRLVSPAAAGVLGDFGDAPNGVRAYPPVPLIGHFPTCIGSADGFVGHLTAHTEVHFGPSVDFETNGNAGACFLPPYDQDECFGPPDAGLIMPDAYTVDGSGAIVPCMAGATVPLGIPCATAKWGGNVDIDVTNNWNTTMYVNVLIDWNQDGRWNGVSSCISGPVPEHVLVNFPVPAFFSGALSTLLPPKFRIGPNLGHVWARFTIGEVPVPANWNGAFTYDLGETEDYLLRVGATGGGAGPLGDYGDAPNGVVAYPPTAVIGHYPTCIGSVDGFVGHVTAHDEVRFGDTVDFETNGNAGACFLLPYDQDECFGPPDAGLITPDSYTINAALVEVTCPGAAGRTLGPSCSIASWGPNVDIQVTNLWPADMFVNVLVDWDQDGRWAGGSACPGGAAPEHVLVNFVVPSGFSGPLSALVPPPFQIGPNNGYVWTRFTIGEVPVPAGWGGVATYDLGESEDYLLRVGPLGADVPRDGLGSGRGLDLEPGVPNPFKSRSVFSFTLAQAAMVRLTVHDAAGRPVAHLGDGWQTAGRHQVTWDGKADDGRALPPGAYFVHARSGAVVRTMKVALIR